MKKARSLTKKLTAIFSVSRQQVSTNGEYRSAKILVDGVDVGFYRTQSLTPKTGGFEGVYIVLIGF